MTTLRTCLLFAFCAPAVPADLTLAAGGKSEYRICVSNEASPSEKRGAGELQRFLLEMSGARLPVAPEEDCRGRKVILVGLGRRAAALPLNIPFERLGEEGFALKTAGDTVVIAGGRKRGTMYGVYALLEKLGCRWFTRDISRIPRLSRITIPPLNEVVTPAFEYREPFYRESRDRDWAARNRVNGSSTRLDESTGGKIAYYPFVHSFYQMIPPDKYFRDHPEYFSLVDGARRDAAAQLCLTNPDVLRLAVEAVFGWIRERPDATIISVSQNDWTGWCECDHCRRVESEEGGAHSGPLIRFVNAIAAEVEKKYPDKLIDTLAYWYTEPPPVTKPRHNVRVRLCPIGACQSHPYEKCPRNAYFIKALQGWSRLTDRLYIWHYVTNFAHYPLPFPNFQELAADLAMYRRMGVKGVFLQGNYSNGGGGENAELRAYVTARLLWDPSQDMDRLVNEFLEGVYGRAAKAMRAYYDWMHAQVSSPERHLYIYMHPGAPYLSREFLDRAERLFAEAEALADNEAVLRRIRRDKMSLEYVRLLQSAKFELTGESYAPRDPQDWRRRLESLMSAARASGMTHLTESRTIEQQESSLRRRIRPYPAVRLSAHGWTLDIVPELNARIVRMADGGGKNVLYEPDPGEPEYPDAGGQVVYVRHDYRTPAPIVFQWRVENAEADSISLAGAAPGGLRMERRIGFTGGGRAVRTEAVLRNESPSGREAVLESRWDIGGGLLAGARVMIRKGDGSSAVTELFRPGEQPAGAAEYRGPDLPAGEWLLRTPAGSWSARFPPERISRASAEWMDREIARVRLRLWSPKTTLRPGESLRLEVDYSFLP